MSYYNNPNPNFYGGAGGGGTQQQQQQQGTSAPQPQHQWMPQAPTHQQQQSQQTSAYQQQPQQPSYMMMPQQQQQQQQQPAAPAPPFWNPAGAAVTMAAAASTGDTTAMMNVASSAGRHFLESGTARMIPGLEMAMLSLRYYFAVDNGYVVLKMKKNLLPFLSKQWKRTEKEPSSLSTPAQYDPPRADENAPDLYIPTMSLITYVLLCALCYGTAGKFDPEVIPDVTTKCFVTQILEVLAIRFGFYMLQAPVSILDLFSYTGYKYLGLCINMVVGLILGHFFGLGHRAYYISFLYTSSAASYFMLKTMANNIPMVTAATGPKREAVVLSFAVSQFASMWFVSQTKFL